MSTAENEVAEAIVESEVNAEETIEEGGIDIDAGVEAIASEMFPNYKPDEKDEEEIEVADDKSQETEEVAEEAEETEEVDEKYDPPQSWKKEMHETWNSLDKSAQEYIQLREEQMKEGVEVKKEDADMGMRLRDAFSPWKSLLESHKTNPVDAAQRLMATHIKIISTPLEQRKDLVNQLAASYGVTLNGQEVDPESQKIMENPAVQKLMNEVNQLRQNQNAILTESQQEREGRISEQVENFAQEHDHFDDLADEIAKLIRADYSLDQAYKVAYRASPFFEQDLEKEREKKDKEAQQAKKKEAEKAKKAKSVNVRGRDTGKAPTGSKGTMEDTMRDVLREINNRN